ncbi:3-ketoacyl-ACP reductase [Mycobacterium sherrisii]|uniref:3-ketoacyl-ACP reductase n=1 Tax=Mycobacterium sherrisii TaxID=243061 RepID=A0A1E3T700_9MYCO|nr:mycofactocin-coupled SDR family oxidoreductase [Mycobacterium sherrisii]ODR10152.1 3-ketoacyl-ACP reductase [Mycobacterium sherrisii]
MKRVAGKVAYITGAARGQGRSHAITLAQQGADIIAVDICSDIETVFYPGATTEDLQQTADHVKATGRRILARTADVRDLAALQTVAQEGVEEFGHIDIVVANAGISSYVSALGMDERTWQNVLDINLTGQWKTAVAVVPGMVNRAQGGSVILVSSVAGLVAYPNMAHYVAAKHGVTGLMRALAVELAPHRIRVNSIHPGTVNTPMIPTEDAWRRFTGDATADQGVAASTMLAMNALPVAMMDSVDISHGVVYLASEESRYVTGTTLLIDAGTVAPFKVQHFRDSVT